MAGISNGNVVLDRCAVANPHATSKRLFSQDGGADESEDWLFTSALRQLCRGPRRRLRSHLEAAAEELERTVKELGFVGTLLIGRPGDTFLDDPRYDPILAKLNELRMPVYLHPGVPLPQVQQSYYGGLATQVTARLSLFGWGWHNEAGVHLLRLLLSRKFDEYPNLQVISGHRGEMVPFYISRLNDAIPQLSQVSPALSRKLSSSMFMSLPAASWLSLNSSLFTRSLERIASFTPWIRRCYYSLLDSFTAVGPACRPVAGSLDPGFWVPKCLSHVSVNRPGDGSLCGDPDKALSRGKAPIQKDVVKQVHISLGTAGSMQPRNLCVIHGWKVMLFFAIRDKGYHGHGTVKRQRLQTPCNRGQCRRISDEQIPVKVVGCDGRAFRPGDVEEVSDCCISRPLHCGPVLMKREVQREGTCFNTPGARSKVAHDCKLFSLCRKEDFDVVVRRR